MSIKLGVTFILTLVRDPLKWVEGLRIIHEYMEIKIKFDGATVPRGTVSQRI